jgi:CpeT/CpcT family (DUF1001)
MRQYFRNVLQVVRCRGANRALLAVIVTLATLTPVGAHAVPVLAAAPAAAPAARPAEMPAAATAVAPSVAPHTEPAGISVAVFERFVAGWPGHYDNGRQVARQLAAGVPQAQRNQNLELQVIRIDLPGFGPRAFYAEWYAPDAPATPVRQRIYAFERDAARGAVVLRLHIFPTDAAFVARTVGAWRDPVRLHGLTPADMAPLRGCDVWFHAAGGAFAGEALTGEMEKRRCRFPSFEDPSREIYSWSQMTKTDRVFSYRDGWFNLDGSVYRSWAPDWYVFEKR